MEWLPTLRARKKWNKPGSSVRVGEVVLVMDNNTPRNCWPLGRITNTYPGPDDVVRVVDVRMKDKILRRPVSKLCPLGLP